MPESLLVPTSARVALERIVDYAGLFPPAQLSMPAAAREYERCRQNAHAWMLGKFVVPAERVGELDAALAEDLPVPTAVLLGGEAAIRPMQHVLPESCEITLALPVRELGATRTAIRALRKVLERLALGLPIAVELPRRLSSAALAEAMDALSDSRFAAKIRCGGATPDATPPIQEVADFVVAASRAGVPFKATAGLHHPVRHFNAAAGFVMHGFLNVLGAACVASRYDTATVREVVAEEEASAFSFDERGFLWRDTVLADAEALRADRLQRFLGFGSCSFLEPVDDLMALGILPRQ
ncbi:MAG: hypothetical protein ACYC8W_06290 [Candidatus Tyrphobacter sp.]